MDPVQLPLASHPGRSPAPFLAVAAGLLAAWLVAPASLSARQGPLLAPEVQVRLAVTGLPEEFQASASVLGYRTLGGGLVELKKGDGAYLCLADDPTDTRFHAPCYHKDLEPFMLRGRQIRAAGQGDRVDEIRYAEVEAGTLPMPKVASLYTRNAAPGAWNPATGEIHSSTTTLVIYIPYATSESTGLSLQPKTGEPWLMSPGTPKAHIMFTATMGG